MIEQPFEILVGRVIPDSAEKMSEHLAIIISDYPLPPARLAGPRDNG